MTIDGSTLTATNITADMTALTTNNSRRDGPARNALGTSQFPSATFVLTSPVDLGDAATTGAKTTVTATGDLTVHGVTKTVDIPLEAQLTGDTVVVVGSLPVVFSDFGITAPTAPVVLSVDDHGTMELQLFFTRAWSASECFAPPRVGARHSDGSWVRGRSGRRWSRGRRSRFAGTSDWQRRETVGW